MDLKFIFKDRVIPVPIKKGETLLESAIRMKLPLNHSCGGMGTCGTCRIIIKEGMEKMEPPQDLESEMIESRGFKPQERLACQNEAQNDLIIEIPS